MFPAKVEHQQCPGLVVQVFAKFDGADLDARREPHRFPGIFHRRLDRQPADSRARSSAGAEFVHRNPVVERLSVAATAPLYKKKLRTWRRKPQVDFVPPVERGAVGEQILVFLERDVERRRVVYDELQIL